MLAECKLALMLTTDAYDQEICALMCAGAKDLEIAGVVLPSTVSYTIATNGAVTDTSALSDDLVKRAIITYVRMNFGSPADFDRLKASYETQKAQLMHSSGYTDWGDS